MGRHATAQHRAPGWGKLRSGVFADAQKGRPRPRRRDRDQTLRVREREQVAKLFPALQRFPVNNKKPTADLIPFSTVADFTRRLLPAHKVKFGELANGGKIVDVASDEMSANPPRRQRNQNVKMNLSGLVNIVSLCANDPIHDTPRLNPLSFVRSDDAEVFRQVLDESLHSPGSGTPRKFR